MSDGDDIAAAGLFDDICAHINRNNDVDLVPLDLATACGACRIIVARRRRDATPRRSGILSVRWICSKPPSGLQTRGGGRTPTNASTPFRKLEDAYR